MLDKAFYDHESQPEVQTPPSLRIRNRTARKWLRRMGLNHRAITKGVFVDGHEREDVVKYRNDTFLPQWLALREQRLHFDFESHQWLTSQNSLPMWNSTTSKPLILITHDESTFSSNDSTRYGWIRDQSMPLRPKGRGKGIMVSGFFTATGALELEDTMLTPGLRNDWPKNQDGKPILKSIEFFEYGKDHYWNAHMLINQAWATIRIFELLFPGCQALFAFDNATSHCAYAPDALVASKMRLNSGGKQPKLRDGFDHRKGRPQSMNFPGDYEVENLRGLPKGIKQVLLERGLWSDVKEDGSRFVYRCPIKDQKSTCSPKGGCCAVSTLALEPDFQSQKGSLQEEIEALGHRVIFYPKFHCELNFIERVWCAAKHFARVNCTYNFNDLRKTVPKAMASVPPESIQRYSDKCERLIDAYASGLKYGTKEFTERAYKGHRQVQDPSKW